jgi:hypothetical protein
MPHKIRKVSDGGIIFNYQQATVSRIPAFQNTSVEHSSNVAKSEPFREEPPG